MAAGYSNDKSMTEQYHIGADSMGAMGRSPPQSKSCGGDAPKSAHRNFVTNVSLYASVKWCADFSLKMHQLATYTAS